MEYANSILEAYTEEYHRIWPNGISDNERLDLEALGKKEAQVNAKVRADYYRKASRGDTYYCGNCRSFVAIEDYGTHTC